MGKIGFGYGSEYQLMRFMGRHLQEFNHHVKEAIGSNDDIFWFDFYKQSRRDHELMNMDFISCEKTKKEWDQL